MKRRSTERRSLWARASSAALLLGLSLPARAHELARSEGGTVLDVSGFYKSLVTGVVLPPEAVRAASAHAKLLDEAAAATPPGLRAPATAPPVPRGGVVNAHLFRLASRLRLGNHLDFDVAWQLETALASDALLANGASVGTTVGGVAAVARRRLVEGAGPLAAGPTWRLEHNLDRLAVRVALPFGDLTVGRQVLSWGAGRFWNPTDVLSPFPPTAVDREVRRGFDAARLAIALGELTQLDLLYLPQRRFEDMGGVGRIQTNVGGWDGALSFGKYVRDLVLGADLVGDLGPVGVHAEGAYTLGLPAPGVARERFFRGVLGADVRPHEKWVLMAEYGFNGYGSTRPSQYAAVLSSPRVVRGELFGAGRHQAALAASFLASDIFSAQLAMLANVTDPSALLIPSVEYSFTQTVLVRAGAYVPMGRPPNPRVYDGLTATDVLEGSSRYLSAVATRGLRSEYGSASLGAFLQVGLYVP
jgi:hypothetical protein